LTRFDEHFAFDSDEFEFLYTKKTPDSEESAWKKIVNKLRKHQAGKHDQSTHGGKSGFNVPDYVDLEGKRFSKEAVAEFRGRLDAYDNGLKTKIDEVSDGVAQQRFGKPYSQLTEDEQSSVNASRQDSNGNWYTNQYDKTNNLIYYKDNDGDWKKYQYDSNNNLIHFENNNSNWLCRSRITTARHQF
jgi:hypothetical protein